MDSTLCIHSNVWFGCMACVPSEKSIFYVFFFLNHLMFLYVEGEFDVTDEGSDQ